MTNVAPTASQPHHRDRIVIGGSEGSLRPLLSILAGLPANLPAAVFIVLHRLADSGELTPLLAAHCPLPVETARDGRAIREGVVYVAAPDLHLLLSEGVLRVGYGPRENMARPSIDVLFRSAAVEFGSRTIAVILSGALDDGAIGVSAVVRCGGHGIVQEPDEAVNRQLPTAALRMGPQLTLPAAEIAGRLVRLCDQPISASRDVPVDVAIEARAAFVALSNPKETPVGGEPSHLTCPECDGPLSRSGTVDQEHYRCDVALLPESRSRSMSGLLLRAL